MLAASGAGHRSGNFSEEERLCLALLAIEYPDIELKSYDSATLQKKSHAWRHIVRSFNSRFHNRRPRDTKQIQGCWKRLKAKAKHEFGKQLDAPLAALVVQDPAPPPPTFSPTPRLLQTPLEPLLPVPLCPLLVTHSAAPPASNDSGFTIDSPLSPPSSDDPHRSVRSAQSPVLDDAPSPAHSALCRKRKVEIKVETLDDETDEAASVRCRSTQTDNGVDQLQLNVLLLQEWKLRHECLRAGHGLPPHYCPPELFSALHSPPHHPLAPHLQWTVDHCI